MQEIRLIEDKTIWENFISELQPHTFLHSWEWGEFNLRQNSKVWRLGIYTDQTLVGVALVTKIEARRGSFLFCPHGPLFRDSNQEFLKPLISYLKSMAIQEGVSFVRISPLLVKTEANERLYKNLGFRHAPTHMHSELVWMLDIRPTEEELLAQMRKTTRYSIRKALSDGVEVFFSSDANDVDKFYSIYLDTVQRQHFSPFSQRYIKEEFESFVSSNKAVILFARYQNDIISTAIVIFDNSSAFYHHGATNLKYSKIPAAYLLQWEAIREAKRRGCLYYNFWGIAPEDQPNHPWSGLTMFKKGFGGFSEEYVHAQDLVLNPKYWLTFAVERVRRLKRGL